MIPDRANDFETEADAQAFYDSIDATIAANPNYVLATSEVTAARQAICAECDHQGSVYMLNYCDQCTCFIQVNTRMAKNVCPLNKWVGDAE